MTTITGKIEDLLTETKKIKGEDTEIHYVVVGGKKYNNGFYPPRYGKNDPAKVGDEVIFESEYKFGENKLDYKTFRRTGAAAAQAAMPAPAVLDSNIRLHALNAAARNPQVDNPEEVVGRAQVYEAYLRGE